MPPTHLVSASQAAASPRRQSAPSGSSCSMPGKQGSWRVRGAAREARPQAAPGPSPSPQQGRRTSHQRPCPTHRHQHGSQVVLSVPQRGRRQAARAGVGVAQRSAAVARQGRHLQAAGSGRRGRQVCECKAAAPVAASAGRTYSWLPKGGPTAGWSLQGPCQSTQLPSQLEQLADIHPTHCTHPGASRRGGGDALGPGWGGREACTVQRRGPTRWARRLGAAQGAAGGRLANSGSARLRSVLVAVALPQRGAGALLRRRHDRAAGALSVTPVPLLPRQ